MTQPLHQPITFRTQREWEQFEELGIIPPQPVQRGFWAWLRGLFG